jgi:magnesium chelatase family protein
MIGPPGTGKTMLAERLPGILPPMTESQALESAAVTSISSQGFDPKTWKQRPIRHPHHTASGVALVGGGSHPRPGEISLAHHGVLFLDELPEFDRRVLEVLREPLESGRIVISRAANQAEFPAQFQLIAAMNPCPCGYLGDTDGRCHCTEDQVRRYRQKISGPLLDRIDIHIEVAKVAKEVFHQSQNTNIEDSRTVQRRVAGAYQLQLDRAGKSNHKLTNKEVNKHCKIDDAGSQLLDTAISRLGLSARAIHRILKVARTIADLADAVSIDSTHLSEAISYRRLDRKNLV